MSDGIKQRIDQNIRDTNQFWNAAIEAAALAIEAELLSAYPRVGSYSQAVREAAELVRKLVIYDAAAAVRRLKR